MAEKIKVFAELELFSGENMRKTPFATTYRPLFEFKGARTKISGAINLLDRDLFLPGSSGVVQVTFLKGMISNEYFKVGEAFTISEGGKFNLGKGKIIKIISQ